MTQIIYAAETNCDQLIIPEFYYEQYDGQDDTKLLV